MRTQTPYAVLLTLIATFSSVLQIQDALQGEIVRDHHSMDI